MPFVLRKATGGSTLRGPDVLRGDATGIYLASSIDPEGALRKVRQETLTGSLAPATVLQDGALHPELVTATLSPAGTFASLQKTKVILGTLTSGGPLGKLGQKVRTGALTPAGALGRVRRLNTLTSALTSAGATMRAVTLRRTATLSPGPGIAARLPQNYITGALGPVGVKGGAPRATRRIAATLAPAGSLVISLLGTIFGDRGCAQQSLAPAALAIQVVEERQVASMALAQTGRGRQTMEACA